jgi:hypothetical protein
LDVINHVFAMLKWSRNENYRFETDLRRWHYMLDSWWGSNIDYPSEERYHPPRYNAMHSGTSSPTQAASFPSVCLVYSSAMMMEVVHACLLNVGHLLSNYMTPHPRWQYSLWSLHENQLAIFSVCIIRQWTSQNNNMHWVVLLSRGKRHE